jgi:hypothetical protein
MSYTKTSPVPPNLQTGETAVTLDDGTIVAVSAQSTPQPNNAPSFIRDIARVINADGTSQMDSSGKPIMVEYRDVPSFEQANNLALLGAVMRDYMMAVIGEPLTVLTDPIHANAIANASIRNRLAALAAAGSIDAGSLL